MDFLKSNYEKVALGVALVLLSLSIVNQIISVNQVIGSAPDMTRNGDILEVQEFSEKLGLVEKRIDISNKFMDPTSYVYCVTGSCNTLHKAEFTDSCPWCDAEQVGSTTAGTTRFAKDTDTDGGGIPDIFEAKLGLDKADPSDEKLDLDGDGFTNIEEYLAKTGLKDKEEYPSLTSRLSFKGITEEKLNFRIDLITKMGDDRSGWDIQVTTFKGSKRTGSEFLLIGDDLPDGYKIMDIGLSGESVQVTDGKQTFSVNVGDRPSPPNSERVILVYSLKGKNATLTLKKGETFNLQDASDEDFEYKVKSYRDSVAVIVDDLDEEYNITLPTPEENGTEEGVSSEDSGFQIRQ